MTSNCKNCGSASIRKEGRIILVGRSVQRYQCKSCGRSFTVPSESRPLET